MYEGEVETSKREKEVADCSAKNISFAGNTANIGLDEGRRKYSDASVKRVSIKVKLEEMKAKATERDMGKLILQKSKEKEKIIQM